MSDAPPLLACGSLLALRQHIRTQNIPQPTWTNDPTDDGAAYEDIKLDGSTLKIPNLHDYWNFVEPDLRQVGRN